MELQNSNKTFDEFSFVKDIDGKSDVNAIKIKIVLTWKCYYNDNPDVESSFDMLMEDEKGHRIWATVKKGLISHFQKHLKEGGAYIISNFGIASNNGKFKVVNHESKINFYRATIVQPVDEFKTGGEEFRFVNFDDVIQSKVKQSFAFDVIARVISSDDVRIVQVFGRDKRILNCELQDLSGVKVSCALWEEHALKLQKFIQDNSANNAPVVILLQLARLTSFNGIPKVSNSIHGSKLFINEDIQEIQNFMDSFAASEKNGASLDIVQLSSNTILTNQEDYYINYEVKHLDELRDIDKKMGCVVMAELIKIEQQHGWYYMSCRNCDKIVEKKAEASAQLFSCENCGDVSDVYPRLKVYFKAQDSSGCAFLILFEREISKFLMKSSTALFNKMQKSSKFSPYPEELKKMLSKRYVFRVQISDYNLRNKNKDEYTVNKMTDDEEVIKSVLLRSPHSEDFSQAYNDSKEVDSVIADNISPLEIVPSTSSSPGAKRAVEELDTDMHLQSSTSKTVPFTQKLKQPKLEK